MKNVLVILGSILPYEKSVSTKIMSSFLEEYKKLHEDYNFKIIDVDGVGDIALTRTMFEEKEDVKDHKIMERRKELLEDYIKADIILLASPMWNFGLPGKVKEVIDCFCVAQKTFKYLDEPNEQGSYSMALHNGKKMLHVAAMGGFNTGDNDVAHKQVEKLFTFIGVDELTYFPVEGTDLAGSEERIEDARHNIKKLAELF